MIDQRLASSALPPHIILSLLILMALALACGDDVSNGTALETAPPEWIEQVFPEPGATASVVDAIGVHHRITDPDEDVRLVIDGVDVTAYSSFDAAVMRYESGVGPVELTPGEHWAEARYVSLPAFGGEMVVNDTYRWEFILR